MMGLAHPNVLRALYCTVVHPTHTEQQGSSMQVRRARTHWQQQACCTR